MPKKIADSGGKKPALATSCTMSRKLCCKNNEKNNFVLFLEQKFREILQLKNSINFVKSEIENSCA